MSHKSPWLGPTCVTFYQVFFSGTHGLVIPYTQGYVWMTKKQ
jgi:hypothetical protein